MDFQGSCDRAKVAGFTGGFLMRRLGTVSGTSVFSVEEDRPETLYEEQRRLAGLRPSMRERASSLNESSVAETILLQLGGASRLRAMLGVKHFTSQGNSLNFRFPNNRAGMPNYVSVTLEADDTYTVEFLRLRGLNHKRVAIVRGVYVEDLRRVIEDKTKLRLSL